MEDLMSNELNMEALHMKNIIGGILKSKMKNSSSLLLIVLIVLVLGVIGCKDSRSGYVLVFRNN